MGVYRKLMENATSNVGHHPATLVWCKCVSVLRSAEAIAGKEEPDHSFSVFILHRVLAIDVEFMAERPRLRYLLYKLSSRMDS
ncbi:hypothetical protein PsorP6_006072 [Peronosclerospora sorghi]|uniref:Uncharacterized protein n=1 Tax=Peronosclerospora sorghi TaxID=230839 RepID=A0ACC0W0Z5_9STRA|nr:hypothetical protein PsorP6_006072 [Peronosclerospora sorghi]